MKLFLPITIVYLIVICSPGILYAADPVVDASGVITRTFGARALDHVKLDLLPSSVQGDVFEYSAKDGELTVRGSSPVAIASGFYQFIRRTELGIDSWTGARLDRSKPWPDTASTRIETPYALRYYFNVVTFGYTMPYWDWNRWQQEIDWMALHGINMPLALTATEAISSRVWKQVGLTKDEVGEFYTGPAHLPWQRMGNMAKMDGPLTDAWNADQISLEHKILDRERALGMHPIAPGFAGFVPKGLQRLHPEIELRRMRWVGFSPSEQNFLMSPEAPIFAEIGKLHVQEWEKEFGKTEYFLADSFNEMKLPVSGESEVNDLLQHYGDVIYHSIAAGDPDATWVMQGWIFVNDSKTWTPDALQALLKNVPDDKMLILDEAIDYSPQLNGGKTNSEKYQGYFNKRWVAGYIPNMGGCTSFTGKMDFYGRGVADLLNASNHGRLSGIGIVPEGIENNEALYELIADTIWTNQPIDIKGWLKTYVRSRYGPSSPESVNEALEILYQGPYSHFHDHPHFSWQLSPGRGRQAGDDPAYLPAAEKLLAAAPQLKNNPLYQADALELSCLAAGGYAERLINTALIVGDMGDSAGRKAMANRALTLLDQMDQALSLHPTHRLERWVTFARSHGTTPEEEDRYEANAKLLVSLWGHHGEISDYSNRMWSGLISTYYVPRWRMYFDSLDGAKTNRTDFEQQWYRTPMKSAAHSTSDPIETAKALIAECQEPIPAIKREPIGKWAPDQMSIEWKTLDWPVKGSQLSKTTIIEFQYQKGAHRLDIRSVDLLDGDQSVAHDQHEGRTGIENVNNNYTISVPNLDALKTYTLRASVRSDGGTDSKGSVSALQKPLSGD